MTVVTRVGCYASSKGTRREEQARCHRRCGYNMQFLLTDNRNQALDMLVRPVYSNSFGPKLRRRMAEREAVLFLNADKAEFVRPPTAPNAVPQPMPEDWDIIVFTFAGTELDKKQAAAVEKVYYPVSRLDGELTCFLVRGRIIGPRLVDDVFGLPSTDLCAKYRVYYVATSSTLAITSGHVLQGAAASRYFQAPTEAQIKVLDDGTTDGTTDDDTRPPFVSLITPVSRVVGIDVEYAFYVLVTNFYELDYPADRLEWIIVDDTAPGVLAEGEDPEQCPTAIRKVLPAAEKRIRYIRCSTGTMLALGRKLNIAMQNASPEAEVFMHFFAGTLYAPASVWNRVRALTALEYAAVCTTEIGAFNVHTRESFLYHEVGPMGRERAAGDEKAYGNRYVKNIAIESTLAYRRAFWTETAFAEGIRNDNFNNTVSIPFLLNRETHVLNVPYVYIGIRLVFESKTAAATPPSNDADGPAAAVVKGFEGVMSNAVRDMLRMVLMFANKQKAF